MEIEVQITFKKILKVVKTMTAAQKARLRQELADNPPKSRKNTKFTELLLKGPFLQRTRFKQLKKTKKALQHGGQKINDRFNYFD